MLLVVACHCFGDVSTAKPAIISLLAYLEMPCNGLFFAVSGSLLLPIKGTTGDFIKKRLSKILLPTIIWSIFYMILRGGFSVTNVLGILFSPQGSGILWFMYCIAGLYLISPILSAWLTETTKKELEFYLFLWAITLCFPIISNWLDIEDSVGGWTYYISGYIGYFLLGYYMRCYPIQLKISALLYVVFFILMMSAKLWFPLIKLYNGDYYLSIFCPIGVIFYWTFIKNITEKFFAKLDGKFIAKISNLIFGLYFVHIGFVTYLVPLFNTIQIPYLLRYILSTATVFIGALSISWLISYLPFASYLIGYQNKKKK